MDVENLLKNPAKEVNRLAEVYFQRENFNPENDVRGKIKPLIKTFGLMLLHPKVRKAFKKAAKEVDFGKMGLDEADRYHVLSIGDYDYMGMNGEARMKKYQYLHKDIGMPPTIKMTKV